MKWANSLICAVHYDKDHSRIEMVRVMSLIGDDVKDAGELTRAAVAHALLDTRFSIRTIYNKAGAWVDGEVVRAVKIENEVFIRTDANNTKADNLGDLAEY